MEFVILIGILSEINVLETIQQNLNTEFNTFQLLPLVHDDYYIYTEQCEVVADSEFLIVIFFF